MEGRLGLGMNPARGVVPLGRVLSDIAELVRRVVPTDEMRHCRLGPGRLRLQRG